LGLSNTANAESFDEEYPHGTCSVGACDGAPITYDNTPAPRIDPDWSNNNGGPTADKEELDSLSTTNYLGQGGSTSPPPSPSPPPDQNQPGVVQQIQDTINQAKQLKEALDNLDGSSPDNSNSNGGSSQGRPDAPSFFLMRHAPPAPQQ
jgi:hypothetical protein